MKTLLIRSVLLSGAITLTLSPYAFATSAINQTSVSHGAAYLATQQAASGKIGSTISDSGWSAVALAASGLNLSTVKTAGGTSLRDYLAANPPASNAAATDWERSIIALTADGQNPYSFGGVNYVTGLRSFVNGGQIGSPTAVNDDLFGLIALMAARVDTGDPVVSQELSYVLSAQRADGGFSYTTDTTVGSDTNDTAAAVMALVAARNAGLGTSSLNSALTDAKQYLLGTQNKDGGFPYDPLTPISWGGPVSDVSSTSWVLMGLTALSDDSTAAGLDAASFIRAAQNGDGSFPYQAPAAGDVLDSAPAVTALAGGQYPLHIFAGEVPTGTAAAPTPSPTPTGAGAASPSPTATPAPAVTSGTVLGAATAAAPSPGPAVASDSVLGASTLPVTGAVSNLLLLGLAFVIATATGFAVRLRQVRAKR